MVVCAICAALAVWWLIPPGVQRRTASGPAAPIHAEGNRDGANLFEAAAQRRVRAAVVERLPLVLAGVGASGAASLAALAGARAGVVAASVTLAAYAGARSVRAYRRGRAARIARDEVATACRLLASQLRAGSVPARALAVAADDCGVLRPAARVRALGGEVPEVWRVQSARPGYGGLLALARAWEVASVTGASLTVALDDVALSLATDKATDGLVAGELAAPKATGKVMAVLPLCGVGLGYLLGGDPIGWLTAGPMGWACLVTGIGLAAAGVAWLEALARTAASSSGGRRG